VLMKRVLIGSAFCLSLTAAAACSGNREGSSSRRKRISWAVEGRFDCPDRRRVRARKV